MRFHVQIWTPPDPEPLSFTTGELDTRLIRALVSSLVRLYLEAPDTIFRIKRIPMD